MNSHWPLSEIIANKEEKLMIWIFLLWEHSMMNLLLMLCPHAAMSFELLLII